MIKQILTLTGAVALFLLGLNSLSAQSLRGFNYQAVARDAAGNLLANQNATVGFDIRQGSATGTLIYQETHNTNTNGYGLINLVIGKGTAVTGSFAAIDWSANDYFLGVTLNGSPLGATELESVPYSKIATDMRLNQLLDVSAAGPATGEVLKWNGTAWAPATDAGTTYSAGAGLSLIGTTFSALDPSPTNEIQTLSVSGNQLSISSGNAVTLPASSVWSTNSTHAFYNTGNVGIGTNTPHNRLQLHNSDIFAGSPSALQLTNNNTGSTANRGLLLTLNSTVADYGLMGGLLMRETNAPLGFGANNNYHLFLKETGLLGLGTFTPQGKMEITYNSTSHTNPNLTLTHSSDGFARISFRSDIAANKYWVIASRTQASDAASQFNLFYHNGTSGQNIVSLNGEGNVGIATSSPSEKLHVNGNARITHLGINTAAPTTEHLHVNGDARITFLGINTSPTERLDVDGNIRVTGEVNRPPTGAANLVPICYGNVAPAGTINTGSGNFTVVRTGPGVYEITITGENYFFNNYVAQATLLGDAGFISTSSINGNLLVRTYVLGVGAVASDRNFSFAVFKP